MDRRTKGDQDRRARRAARRRGDRDSLDVQLERTLAVVIPAIRAQARGLHAEIRPLAAEIAASDLLSTWQPDEPWNREAFEVLGTAALRRLGERPDPDTLTLLLAVAAIGEAPFADAARRASERIGSGVPVPSWGRALGDARFVDAWIATDVLEDQSLLVATFEHAGREPHSFVGILDANFGGLIRSLDITLDASGVRERWLEAGEAPIRPLDAQTLADLLGRGIEQFDGYLDPPTSDGGRALMPLLRARMRALPKPRPIDVPEVGEEEREALVEAFAASDEARGMRSVEGEPAALLASWFVDYACDYGAGDPLRWSPIAVELLMVDWLPRKATMSDAEVAAIPRVLTRFVRYCAARKGLSAEQIAETLAAVRRFTPQYREAMADESTAGPAKALVLEMRAAGVDFSDAQAVQAYISRRNAELGFPDNR